MTTAITITLLLAIFSIREIRAEGGLPGIVSWCSLFGVWMMMVVASAIAPSVFPLTY